MRDVTEGGMLPVHIKERENRRGLGISHLVMDDLKELQQQPCTRRHDAE